MEDDAARRLFPCRHYVFPLGRSRVRYLRLNDSFIVLATEGTASRFWQEDRRRIRDVRNIPIRFKGYSISYRQGGWKDRRTWADPLVRERDMKWHVRVQLDADTYAGVKAYFLNIATHRQADFLARELTSSLLPRQLGVLIDCGHAGLGTGGPLC